MNRHRMSLAELCFDWQGKTAHINWTQGKELIYLPPPPLVEHSCDADTASLQYPHPRRRSLSRPLNPLPENEGV